MSEQHGAPAPIRRKISIERSLSAPIEEVWELWTTAEGIESWWGPEGFSVAVKLSNRPTWSLCCIRVM